MSDASDRLEELRARSRPGCACVRCWALAEIETGRKREEGLRAVLDLLQRQNHGICPVCSRCGHAADFHAAALVNGKNK